MRRSPAGEQKASSATKESQLAGGSQAHRPVFKTGVDLSSTNGLIAAGRIQGQDCRIIIDTGSNVSIVSPEVLQKSKSLVTVQPAETTLRTVTGATAPIQGKGLRRRFHCSAQERSGHQTVIALWLEEV